MTQWMDDKDDLIDESDEYIDAEGTRYPADVPKEGVPGLKLVVDGPIPEKTSQYQRVVQDGVVRDENGTPVRQWALQDFTADEIAAKRKAEIDTFNAPILEQLAANDKKVIRALVEGDTARIEAYKQAQADLRAQLKK